MQRQLQKRLLLSSEVAGGGFGRQGPEMWKTNLEDVEGGGAPQTTTSHNRRTHIRALPPPADEFHGLQHLEEGWGARTHKPQCWGFRGAHGPGYMGLAAAMRVPMGTRVPVLSPNDGICPPQCQQNDAFRPCAPLVGTTGRAQVLLHGSPWVFMHSSCQQMITQGSAGVVGGHPEIVIFQPTHAGLKTAKSSPVGPHKGDRSEYPEIRHGAPTIGLGVTPGKKSSWRLRSKLTQIGGFGLTKL